MNNNFKKIVLLFYVIGYVVSGPIGNHSETIDDDNIEDQSIKSVSSDVDNFGAESSLINDDNVDIGQLFENYENSFTKNEKWLKEENSANAKAMTNFENIQDSILDKIQNIMVDKSRKLSDTNNFEEIMDENESKLKVNDAPDYSYDHEHEHEHEYEHEHEHKHEHEHEYEYDHVSTTTTQKPQIIITKPTKPIVVKPPTIPIIKPTKRPSLMDKIIAAFMNTIGMVNRRPNNVKPQQQIPQLQQPIVSLPSVQPPTLTEVPLLQQPLVALPSVQPSAQTQVPQAQLPIPQVPQEQLQVTAAQLPQLTLPQVPQSQVPQTQLQPTMQQILQQLQQLQQQQPALQPQQFIPLLTQQLQMSPQDLLQILQQVQQIIPTQNGLLPTITQINQQKYAPHEKQPSTTKPSRPHTSIPEPTKPQPPTKPEPSKPKPTKPEPSKPQISQSNKPQSQVPSGIIVPSEIIAPSGIIVPSAIDNSEQIAQILLQILQQPQLAQLLQQLPEQLPQELIPTNLLQNQPQINGPQSVTTNITQQIPAVIQQILQQQPQLTQIVTPIILLLQRFQQIVPPNLLPAITLPSTTVNVSPSNALNNFLWGQVKPTAPPVHKPESIVAPIPAPIAAPVPVPTKPVPVQLPTKPLPINLPTKPSPVHAPTKPSPVHVPMKPSPVNLPTKPSPVHAPTKPSPVVVPMKPSPVHVPTKPSTHDSPTISVHKPQPIHAPSPVTVHVPTPPSSYVYTTSQQNKPNPIHVQESTQHFEDNWFKNNNIEGHPNSELNDEVAPIIVSDGQININLSNSVKTVGNMIDRIQKLIIKNTTPKTTPTKTTTQYYPPNIHITTLKPIHPPPVNNVYHSPTIVVHSENIHEDENNYKTLFESEDTNDSQDSQNEMRINLKPEDLDNENVKMNLSIENSNENDENNDEPQQIIGEKTFWKSTTLKPKPIPVKPITTHEPITTSYEDIHYGKNIENPIENIDAMESTNIDHKIDIRNDGFTTVQNNEHDKKLLSTDNEEMGISDENAQFEKFNKFLDEMMDSETLPIEGLRDLLKLLESYQYNNVYTTDGRSLMNEKKDESFTGRSLSNSGPMESIFSEAQLMQITQKLKNKFPSLNLNTFLSFGTFPTHGEFNLEKKQNYEDILNKNNEEHKEEHHEISIDKIDAVNSKTNNKDNTDTNTDSTSTKHATESSINLNRPKLIDLDYIKRDIERHTDELSIGEILSNFFNVFVHIAVILLVTAILILLFIRSRTNRYAKHLHPLV